MTSPALVLPLSHEATLDPELAGGKAASLARLRWLGLPTPPGCCVTVDAYRLYLREAGLSAEEAELRRRAEDADARSQLAALAAAAPLPPAVGEQLRAEVGALAAQRFAVRSSAVGEDGAVASFAGQHDTVLGVRAAEVGTAVQRCWASLWGARSAAYRGQRGIARGAARMAALIQPLLAVRVSVIAFSCDPLTGSAATVLLHAAPGLCPGLAAGTVTPDVVAVDRASLAVTDVTVAAEPVGTPGSPAARSSPVVDAAQAAELAELVLRAERGFGRPIDVEAALVDDRWMLLQARPVSLPGE